MNRKISVGTLAMEAFTCTMLGDNEASKLARLLTKTEKIKIGRRLLIARAILTGKTRMEVNEKLQVSPNTFAQIRRWVESEFTEYTPSTNVNKKTNSNRKHYTPFSFEHLRKRYPGHFLLFTLSKELFK